MYKGVTSFIKLLGVHNLIVCPALSGCFLCFVTAVCLKDMMREYVTEYKCYPDIEELRELLSKVTDEQKLNILQQAKSRMTGRTALHVAAYRCDAEMITTILSSLRSEDSLKLLIMRDFSMCTPLHYAALRGHTESVKAILNSLTANQQMQLLTVEDGSLRGKTAVEMASGETADVLIRYSVNAIREIRKGKSMICHPLIFCLCVGIGKHSQKTYKVAC